MLHFFIILPTLNLGGNDKEERSFLGPKTLWLVVGTSRNNNPEIYKFMASYLVFGGTM